MKRRIQLDVSEQRVESFKASMRLTELDTYKELIESAIAFFEWGITEVGQGRSITSVDAGHFPDQCREFVCPAFNAVRRNQKK